VSPFFDWEIREIVRNSASRHSFTRVSIAIQFISQVFRLSVEKYCSNLQESGLMSEMIKRTRIGRPLKSS
jgi:hypothetical protein